MDILDPKSSDYVDPEDLQAACDYFDRIVAVRKELIKESQMEFSGIETGRIPHRDHDDEILVMNPANGKLVPVGSLPIKLKPGTGKFGWYTEDSRRLRDSINSQFETL